jgi:hypothetical protein
MPNGNIEIAATFPTIREAWKEGYTFHTFCNGLCIVSRKSEEGRPVFAAIGQ